MHLESYTLIERAIDEFQKCSTFKLNRIPNSRVLPLWSILFFLFQMKQTIFVVLITKIMRNFETAEEVPGTMWMNTESFVRNPLHPPLELSLLKKFGHPKVKITKNDPKRKSRDYRKSRRFKGESKMIRNSSFLIHRPLNRIQ